MVSLKLVIIFIVILPEVFGEFTKCTEGYCRLHPCNDVKCKGKNKVLYHNVTTCGCCHRCITGLDEDSDCILEMKGNIPDTECGPHLRCIKDSHSPNNAICKKIRDIEESGCEIENKKIEGNQFQMIANLQPQCDQFGDYHIKQCKNGTLCQCVKPYYDRLSGQIKIRPIFGTDIYTNEKKMNCLCSYQFENINEKIREMTHSLEENYRYRQMLEMYRQRFGESFSGPNGGTGNGNFDVDPIFFVRCKPNGNYHPFQMYGSYIYCVDELTGQLVDRPVKIEHAKELPCYSHRYSYQTDVYGCLKKYNETVQKYYKLKREQSLTMIISYDLPRCDLDGSYAPVQCENDGCYCVNKNGDKFSHTFVQRHDEFFGQSQQCSCVRNQEHIRDIKQRDKITELFAKYQCDINGNYLPLQCSNTHCYCVDVITGYARSDQVMKNELEDIAKLECYHNYPDKQRLRRQLEI